MLDFTYYLIDYFRYDFYIFLTLCSILLLYIMIKGSTLQFQTAAFLAFISLPMYRAFRFIIIVDMPENVALHFLIEFTRTAFFVWGLIILIIITFLRVLMKKRQENDYKNQWRKMKD